MSELEGMISGIMNNPEEMKKIMDIASSIMGGTAKGDEEPSDTPEKSSSPALPNLLSGLTGLSGGALGGIAKKLLSGGLLGGGGGGLLGGGNSGGGRAQDKTALIEAMKPWLSEDRRVKLDRAMKLAKVMRIAGSAFLKDGG